jgi:ABC-type sugar transport system ATPase subunit
MINPDTLVSDLSVAEQQMVEIARALSVRARLIIMDEPTSALSEAEVTRLLSIMRSLKAGGVSIMFVTHRLEEAMAICDRVTILRDGRLAAVRNREGLTIPAIIRLMVGRAASELYRRPASAIRQGRYALRCEAFARLSGSGPLMRQCCTGSTLRSVPARSSGLPDWSAPAGPSSRERSSGLIDPRQATSRSTADL